MANKKQLDFLRRGVKYWNGWRKKNAEKKIDLAGADLFRMDLRGAYFGGVDFTEAYLVEANLSGAKFSDADLSRADLRRTDLSRADLRRVNLREVNLSGANLLETNLVGADLSGATVGRTQFNDVDLDGTIGLDLAKYIYPSSIGIDTIYKSTTSLKLFSAVVVFLKI